MPATDNSVSLTTVHLLRLIVLVLTAMAAGMFVPAILYQGRRHSALLAVAGAEVMFLGAGAAIVVNWNGPLVWYRAPLVGVAAVLFLAFAYEALRGR